MARYILRYFFSPGAGVCLWSVNDEAINKFDYAVDFKSLNLRDNLLYKAYYVLAWYDTSIDWDYPPDPSPWSEDENLRFLTESKNLLTSLRQHLGNEFEIIDESS